MKPAILMVPGEVHPVPPRHGAAVEWWIYQVCRRLVSDWRPVIVCTASEGYADQEVEDGVTFHRIRIGRLYKRLFQKMTKVDPWGYAERAHRRIVQEGAGIVHVHNEPQLYRRLVAKQPGLKHRYLLHLHNEREDLSGLEDARLVVISEYLARWYRERLPRAKIEIVTYGVDREQYRGRRASVAEREQIVGMSLTSGSRVILYAGRISPEKGVLRLVRAFKLLAVRCPDTVLVLAGDVSEGGSGNRRAEYGRRVLEELRGLPAGRASYLGSFPPDRMHEVFGCADLVVMPSEFEEPLGLVALEAMAAGAPLLAARKGGLAEIVREGQTGFFIPEGGEAPFVARMETLLSAGPLLNAVADRARDYVASHHDWSTVAESVSALYRRLVA